MKIRPVVILLVGGVFAVGAILLAGKALTAKAQALPPTGSAQPPAPASPPISWESIAAKDLEEALEDRDDAQDILWFLRHRERRAARISTVPVPIPPVPGHPATQFPSHPVIQSPGASPSEPTIRQVQLAAIRYAEVMPEKIRRWRTLAQLRNFVPHFTLGLDRDRDTTIASSTSGGKTTFAVGPKDESLSVNFGLTWDLANLVWDSAQTSIDVRSRLMVQLRQDILEEATRLYFERQRLRAEFDAAPTGDPILQKERSLRLEELTAQLDALTGGLYSSIRQDG